MESWYRRAQFLIWISWRIRTICHITETSITRGSYLVPETAICKAKSINQYNKRSHKTALFFIKNKKFLKKGYVLGALSLFILIEGKISLAHWQVNSSIQETSPASGGQSILPRIIRCPASSGCHDPAIMTLIRRHRIPLFMGSRISRISAEIYGSIILYVLGWAE